MPAPFPDRFLVAEGPFFYDRHPGLAFAGSGLDRAAHRRAGPDMTGARGVLMCNGQVLCTQDGDTAGDAAPRLALFPPDHPLMSEALGARVFLGAGGPRGEPVFAQDIQDMPVLSDAVALRDLRDVMLGLPPLEAELAATARGILGWHRSHGFCAACGAASEIVQSGWQRHCPSCGADHFPRTDPCVIMLVTQGNDTLLGRNPNWPEGMYSCLAGFMEPGETVEAAVRREVYEETAIRTGRVRPVASQPWPFPASLMMGCRAEATSREIMTDPVEIEDALWVSRERLLRIMAGGDSVIRAPRPGAIAGWLMREWLADRLD
ncbi:NAD(+) diphosphatase [Thioclava sp. GXIMD4215]|uniref:NAD(+) diphosphatase n=1 Tax=Thioclava sp. GXIMD4215 TaxID=3131928 RepID=UPI00324FCAB1